MKHNILFLGGAGFIGSNLIRTLIGRKDDIKVYVLEPSFANISRLDGMEVQVFRGTLQDIDFVQSIIEANHIDTIVHLVATIIPGSTFEDYKREYQQVIFPTIELMQYCAQKDIKFVYFSSGGTVYGNRTDMTPFKETDPMAPISYYGWSKQMMENSILYVHRTAGLKYLIVRPSNPYGHGQNINGKQGIIAVIIGKILRKETIEIWGDGSAVKDYIYIDDFVYYLTKLIESNSWNSVYNIGTGMGYSVNDVLNAFKENRILLPKIQYIEAAKSDVKRMILDCTKIQTRFPHKCKTLQEGIKLFWEYANK